MVEGPVDTIHHFGTLNSCRSLPNEIASNVLVKSDKWSVFDTLQNDNLVSNFKSFISLICKKLWTVIIWAGYTKIIEKLWLEWQTYFFYPKTSCVLSLTLTTAVIYLSQYIKALTWQCLVQERLTTTARLIIKYLHSVGDRPWVRLRGVDTHLHVVMVQHTNNRGRDGGRGWKKTTSTL